MNLNKTKNQSKGGFTIIELIIAIAIVALITGIVLVNYRVGQRQQTVRAEAQKLASTLRDAQNMALAGRTYLHPGQTEEKVPEYGYGVYVDDTNNKYTLFANYCEPDYKDFASTSCIGSLGSHIFDQDIETQDLNLKKIDISVGLEVEGPTPINFYDLVFDFEPPKALPALVFFGPKVITSRGFLNNQTVLITLKLEGTSLERVVRVNASTGQIGMD